MRLTTQEKRARELSQAVKNIGATKRPTISLRDVAARYSTQSDELSMKIAPHIKGLREEIMNEIKAMPQNVEISTDMVRSIVKEMKRLPEGDRLEVQDIRNHQAFIFNGHKYGMHEMMHGGSSGSSITIITVTGTINDSNTSFSASTQPTLLNINGAFYNTSGGAITWSYLAGVITTSSPVGTGGSIYGI